MRVLLVEDLTSGALALDIPGWHELAGEGAAMLRAIAEDARDVPGWHAEVLWSGQLGPFSIPGITVHTTSSPDEERQLFMELAARADRVFVIAPEFDRRLEQRRGMVEATGGRFVGSTIATLSLCGDKLRLAGHLQEHHIPTIPTWLFDRERAEDELARALPGGLVIKPRDGAGSMNTFHVRDHGTLREATGLFRTDGTVPIIQPFVAGRPISVATIVSANGTELFPPAAQHIQYGKQLTYLGGSMGEIPLDRTVEAVIRAALEAVPGLSGYIGVDLIIPKDSDVPVVVEINPRLTTSYLGYRQLATGNLASRVIDPDGTRQPVIWQTDTTIYP